MNTTFVRHLPQRRPPGRQRGVSMFIVMVVLMLALVLMLGGLAVTNMNESIVGNQNDAQRAYNAAQALLNTAQRDIRLNGRSCNAPFLGGAGNNINFTNTAIPGSGACTRRFPRDMSEYMQLVHGTPGPGLRACANGVCISSGPTDPAFTSDKVGNGLLVADNAQQLANGANYNAGFVSSGLDGGDTSDYGGGATTGPPAPSPLAMADGGGAYWVEIFPYNANSSAFGVPMNIPVPDPAYPFVFRITAMARGLKSGTQSVLRTYYTPYPMLK